MRRTRVYIIRALLAASLMLLTANAVSEEDLSQPEDAIARKLNAVQVHYLTLENGRPFSYQRGEQQLIPTFFYHDAAEYFRDDLIEQSQITRASVVATGLGDAYLQRDSQQTHFVLIANPGQLDQARRFNDDPDFDQVPLFAVQHRESEEFLTMHAGGQNILPFFIESQRVVQALKLMESRGEDNDDWRIVAIPLSTIVSDLQSGDLSVDSVGFIGPQ